MTPREAQELERYLTPTERDELAELIEADIAEYTWRPLPGPQTMAYESTADVIGFGGAAGGGKTDLAIGMALNQHHRAQMFRREGPQLVGIIDRLAEIVGSRDNINGKPTVYWDDGRDLKVEFNSVPNLGDETKYQGRPKDLLVVDEAANFLEMQVRFLKGWVRTTRPGQRTRTLLTFNPPTTAEGRWVIDFFAPWLDKKHALYPTEPGKLRYVYVDPKTGKDVWILDDNGAPFVIVHDERCYDFDPLDYRPEEIIKPESNIHPLAHHRQPVPGLNGLHGAVAGHARATAQPDAAWRLRGRHGGRPVPAHPDQVGRDRPSTLERAHTTR